MSNRFRCLITGGSCNNTATEFTFRFVDSTQESRFLALIENQLSIREIACNIDFDHEMPRRGFYVDRWSEGPLVYCLPEDVAHLEARLERAEQLNAELLAAAKEIVEWYDSATEVRWPLNRLRAAIAKAEGEEA